MRLFLASEAKHPESMKKLEVFVGGLKGKSIAYIPTAANGKQAYGQWREGETWKLVNSLDVKVTLVQLEDYKNPSVIAKLKDQDIIWFAGGACSYLMYWILRCEIDKYLPRLLEKSIYVGSSAGSMVTAKTLKIAEWYPGEPEYGASFLPGLGLVNFDFYPHFDETMYNEIKKLYQGNKLFLVKNGEAITVVNKQIKVLGEQRVITK